MATTTTTTDRPPILTPEIREKILAHVRRYPEKRAVTLPALHIVHEHLRCVPRQAMEEIAELLEVTPADVHDTMSFYGFFHQAPLGETRVWICRSISCMLTGGEEALEKTCAKLGVRSGQTTEDGKVTIEFAECLGICDYAPAALADDGRVFGPLTDDAAIDRMIDDLRKGPVGSQATHSQTEPAVESPEAAADQ